MLDFSHHIAICPVSSVSLVIVIVEEFPLGINKGFLILMVLICQVNLSGAHMKMRQPFACPVRRNFLSGIQVELKQSVHQRSLRAQLHWLQVNINTFVRTHTQRPKD